MSSMSMNLRENRMGLGTEGAVIVVALWVLAFFIACAVFQWLWNTTMPDQFGLKRVRYWVAVRLLLIAALLASGGQPIKLNPPPSGPVIALPTG